MVYGRDRDVVDLEELHAALAVRTEFGHWGARRIEAYGIERSVWTLVTGTFARGGVRYVNDVYRAKTFTMVELTAVGRAVRGQYMRVEKTLHAVAAAPERQRRPLSGLGAGQAG